MNFRFKHCLTLRNPLLFLAFAVAALLQPCTSLAQSYALKTLYNFNGSDSQFPRGLTRDSQGNLYGIASQGGSSGYSNNGIVYKFSPAGVLTTLAVFDGLDGDLPDSPMIDAAGNLWGTTLQGGYDWHPERNHYGFGTLYKISSTGVFTPGIIEFTGPHGIFPTGSLTMDAAGNLIGTTEQGGGLWNAGLGDFGSGTIFQFSSTGALSNPLLFNGGNGQSPMPVVRDSQGNLYGTTVDGGPQGYGTIYKLSPTGVHTILSGFHKDNGSHPSSSVVMDSQGNLYGTTYTGGTSAGIIAGDGYGTIWKWSPAGGLTTLVNFNGANGMFPFGIIRDAQGNLFGTTRGGGTTGNGVLYEYSANGTLSTLVDFDGANKGGIPDSALCLDSQGVVYGVTGLYGPGGYGTLFAAQPVNTTLSIASITVNATTVPGGDATQGTVTISRPAPAGGMVVTLGSNNSNVTPQGPVTIPAGATSATFTVSTQIVTDISPVTISARLGSSVQQTLLTVAPPTTLAVAVLAINPDVIQGGVSSSGSVTLNKVAPVGGSVVTLSSNSPLAAVPASVTVPAGALTANFPISTQPVAANTSVTITASLGSSALQYFPLLTPPPTTSTNVISFTVNFPTVQGGTPLVGRVFVNGDAPGGVTVALASNSPAVVVPASMTVPQGAGIANVPIQTTAVTSDTVATITATLNGSSLSATVSVLAPKPTIISSLSLDPTSVQGGHSSQGIVTLSNVAPAGGAIIAFFGNSSAIGLPFTVTVPEGETFVSFAITTALVPATTSATVTATAGSSSSVAALTITSGIPGITLTSFTINPTGSTTPGTAAQGGNPAGGSVFLSAPAPWGGAYVTLASSDPNVATVPATVVVPPGQTGISFFIITKPVIAPATVTLTATFGAVTKTASLTVNPVPALASITFNPGSVGGGQSATGIVTLSAAAPAGGEIVTLTNSSTILVPSSVTVAAGATSASFPVTTFAVTANTTATVTGKAGGVSQQGTLMITLVSVANLTSLTLTPATIPAGASSRATVTLSQPAPAGGAPVGLVSTDFSVITLPGNVIVPAGATSATFTITGKPVTASTAVILTATYLGVNQTALLTITPVSMPADTVSVSKAEYITSAKSLHVEATSSNKTATLSVYVTSTGALIGSLPGDGSGRYKGDLSLISNPQNITVKSSSGGSAGKAVTAK